MYVPHHDSLCLPCHVDAGTLGEGDTQVPALSASASRDADGQVHLTMTNLSATDTAPVSVALHGLDNPVLRGRVLTGDAMNSHNTFDAPDTVCPVEFDELRSTAHGFDVQLPPRSVVAVSAG